MGDDGRASGGGLVLALGAVAAAAGFVTLGAVVAMGGTEETDLPPVADRVLDVGEDEVSEEAFLSVELGATKEEVTEQLRPALPVETRILDRYEQRSPETVASSCVYYESEPPPPDDLYRFCFEEDVLVEKTFVLREDEQLG